MAALAAYEMFRGLEITTHSGADYYYLSAPRDREGSTSYAASLQHVAEDATCSEAGIDVPGLGLIPWVDSLDMRKIRRRIEDRLRKADTNTLLRIAGWLDVKLT